MYLKHRKKTRVKTWVLLLPQWALGLGKAPEFLGLWFTVTQRGQPVRDFATSALNSNITSASLPAWQLSKPLWLLFLTLTPFTRGTSHQSSLRSITFPLEGGAVLKADLFLSITKHHTHPQWCLSSQTWKQRVPGYNLLPTLKPFYTVNKPRTDM